MEKTEETSARFNLTLEMNSFSSDLLHKRSKPTSHSHLKSNEVEEEDPYDNDDELELSLGLSMNGRFGVDPTRKKLKRSSSISSFPFTTNPWDNGGVHHRAGGAACEAHQALLPRTRSLPTEAEEEWRKRKEYQAMRRFEARKKRLEKVRSGMRLVAKDKVSSSEDVGCNGFPGNNGGVVTNDDGAAGNVNGIANALVGLQRSGLSQSCDLDQGQQLDGPKQNTDVPPHRSPENQNQENSSNGGALNRNASVSKESQKNAMLDMPHVTTRESGPNGRKIEGFLYRYKKGEEVSIVCVCHGMFLSPAEFVKHGGGGSGADVDNPLKHIVVNPFPLV